MWRSETWLSTNSPFVVIEPLFLAVFSSIVLRFEHDLRVHVRSLPTVEPVYPPCRVDSLRRQSACVQADEASVADRLVPS